MAKTEYIDIIPNLEKAFFTGVQSGDRFNYARIRRKIVFYSVKKKLGLTARSLLPAISAF